MLGMWQLNEINQCSVKIKSALKDFAMSSVGKKIFSAVNDFGKVCCVLTNFIT